MPLAESLASLLTRVRACRICAASLPRGPRPVLRVQRDATLLIIGQAPGTKVHESGIPWNDRSGDQLRSWLAVDKETFYDESRIAIIPMGFCYPGVNPRGGDNPPRPECAMWHEPLLAHLPNIALTLLIGMYAQKHYLGARRHPTLTATVAAWRDYGPGLLPLPHPSWRNLHWRKKNPWFEEQTVPALQRRVRALL
jgi:uracil-DNA glycosylase